MDISPTADMTQFRSATEASCFAADAALLARELSECPEMVGIDSCPSVALGCCTGTSRAESGLDVSERSVGNVDDVDEDVEQAGVAGTKRVVVDADPLVVGVLGLGTGRVAVCTAELRVGSAVRRMSWRGRFARFEPRSSWRLEELRLLRWAGKVHRRRRWLFLVYTLCRWYILKCKPVGTSVLRSEGRFFC